MDGILRKTVLTFEMIKFSHSIFALPFALASLFIAAQGWPDAKIFLLILLCMVSARSSAMAFNRWIDAPIDAKNPRTNRRHIPQGLLSKNFVIGFTFISSLLFVFFSSLINTKTFLLSPFGLAWILGYSFTKRFTSLSHFWLGISLGLAPLAAWMAITDQWPWPALSLGIAVTFWVAGFDILYALQDFTFDREAGLFSIVKKFGAANALWISRGLHFLSVLFLLIFGLQHYLGLIYLVTVLLIASALIYEQSLVSPDDLSKIDAAFFTMNGLISILYFVGVFISQSKELF